MYTIGSKSAFIVQEGIPSVFGFLANDKPGTSGQEMLAEYLDDARGIFKAECDLLLSTRRTFTEADATRLGIMFKLLIDARNTWQEEENSSRAADAVQG